MNNKTLTESMSDLTQKLRLIESSTNEAATSAAEKAAEKLGVQSASSALRGTAAKARAKLAAAKDKALAATDKLPGGAVRASKRAKIRKVKQHVASIKQHVYAGELRAAAEVETNAIQRAALARQAEEATANAERLAQAAGDIDKAAAEAVMKDAELAALKARNPEVLNKAIDDAEAAANKVATTGEKTAADAAATGEKTAVSAAATGEKTAVSAADDAGVAAEKGYVPATRDPAAVDALNAEQRATSDYFAKPENHVVRDGKAYGRDPNKVGEFVELDAKTLMPKGDLGVNRASFYTNGALNRELEALEKQGARKVEIAKAEEKALNSAAVTAVEKAEIKAGGILNWIRNNPRKAAVLGLLAGIVTAGTIASLMAGEEEKIPGAGEEVPPEEPGGIEGLPSAGGDKPPGTSGDIVQTNPADLEKKILALIAELEKEPTCQADVVRLKADLARIKGQAAAPVAPVPPVPPQAQAQAAAGNTPAANPATGKLNLDAKCKMCGNAYKDHFNFEPAGDPNGKVTSTKFRHMANPTDEFFPGLNGTPTTPQAQAQAAAGNTPAANDATSLTAELDKAAGNTPAGGSDMMTGRDIMGRPVMKGSPNDVSGKEDPLKKVGGLAENDELARWLKIARGR
jgi:hypothetical protein